MDKSKEFILKALNVANDKWDFSDLESSNGSDSDPSEAAKQVPFNGC